MSRSAVRVHSSSLWFYLDLQDKREGKEGCGSMPVAF
jgi:hypothetical protein